MKKLAFNIVRLLVALTFVVSGFVKAVDPIGTQYKLHDYLVAMGADSFFPDLVLLLSAIGLSTVEFVTGVFLLFAIHCRLVSRFSLLFMTVMTCVTVWIYATDPVSDCGCFGDAIQLTNGQTLAKNLVLLCCTALLARYPRKMARFVSVSNQWIVSHYTFLFILATSVWSLYDLPVFDFRPYHVGADIKEGMKIPEGEEAPQFETTFILQKDGVQKEFTLEEYPDSTWEFVDSKTTQVSEGYVPPIHDFSITTADGDDITMDVLEDKGYTFLLISPHLEQADDSNFGNIDMLYEYANDYGYPFYCLTASGDSAISRWHDLTGAEYPFCTTDETTLKTIIRSNPGLLLIKDGKVIRKWSHNSLPVDPELLSKPLAKSELGKMPDDTDTDRLLAILLWYVLPLVILTMADRLWMWSHWIKNKEKKINDTLGITPVFSDENTEDDKKTNKNNEKENCSRQLEDEHYSS